MIQILKMLKKKINCNNIEYSSDRESRKDAEFECTVYPGIVNVDSKPKDNSEEQYTFIQNHMHTQELDNDEDDEEYKSDHCASSDHKHGQCKTDDEEYESNHCENCDDENGGHKNDDKEYEIDLGDSCYNEDEDGGNKMDENYMVTGTLSVSPSGSISTK